MFKIMILKILLILIIFIFSLYLITNFLYKKTLISDFKKIRNKALQFFNEHKKLSENTLFVLKEEYTELSKLITNMDTILLKPPNNQELKAIINNNENLLLDVNTRINEKKEKWEEYCYFKSNVDFIKIDIEHKIREIQDNGQHLLSIEHEYKDLIQKKIDEAVTSLKSLINEYIALEKATFNYFNFYILEEVQNDYAEMLIKTNNILTEFSLFDKEIKVYLTDFYRKSTYYISLDSKVENKRRRDISVTYKTFINAFNGKTYKKDVIISNKYIIGSQGFSLKVLVHNEVKNYFTKELELEDFESLFEELSIAKDIEEKDENGIPFNLSLSNVDILVCEKARKSFELINHYKFFKTFSLNDFLIMNDENIDNEVLEKIK